MAKDKLAILTIIHKNLSNLNLLFSSLYNQNYKDFKMFIVNNYPSNNADTYLEEINKKYQINYELIKQEENTGYARGNNIGAKQAISQGFNLIFIINDDVYLNKECLNELVKYNKTFDNTVITAPILIKGLPSSHKIIQNYGVKANFKNQSKETLFADIDYDSNNLPDSMKVDYVSGAALLLRSDIIKKHGLFDEDYFMYNDEIDMAYRMKKADIEYYVTKKAIAWHNHDWSDKNITGYKFMYYYMMRNRYLYFKKYKLYKYMIYDLLKQVLAFPFTSKMFIKIGSFSIIKYYYAGIIKGIAGEKGQSKIVFE